MFEPICETKVCYYHVPVSIEEEVFEFEVTVDDLLLVDVPDTRDELSEELAGILFLQVAVGQDMVEKFATRRVFEDYTDVLVRLDNVVQPDNVRMLKSLRMEKTAGRDSAGPNKESGVTKWIATHPEDFDFTFNFGHSSRCVNVSSSDQLHRDFFSPLHMQAEFDLAEFTLPEGLKQ